ncbi:MAG: hypothetical protein V3S64_00900 [bacterium]
MKDECIAFELPDGTVRYATCPVRYKKPGETKTQWLLRAFHKTVAGNPDFAAAKRILNPVMPDGGPLTPGQPKQFHAAWRHAGGGQIVVDMPAARKLKMDQIRAEREGRFPPLDAEWMKAMGQGNSAAGAAIEAKRQHLRELPQTVDLEAIATPEELETFEPAWPTEPRG